jgi:SAM-dependent methyltransferase
LLPLLSYFLFSLAAFIGYFFLSGFIWGAGYYPTSRKEIDVVARLLALHENSRFYDLGSGYGRMIFSMAEKFGTHSIGVEADPVKCWWTRRGIRRKRLEKKVEIIHSNFLNANLTDADAIFVFLTRETKIMERLFSKICNECRPGTKVVSFEHPFKKWKPMKREGRLFLYSLEEDSIERTSKSE